MTSIYEDYFINTNNKTKKKNVVFFQILKGVTLGVVYLGHLFFFAFQADTI